MSSSTLWLVRHADAGSRGRGKSDLERPLSPRGRAEAEAIAAWLAADVVIPRLYWSSPYLRCIETLQPAVLAAGARVKVVAELGEGGGKLDWPQLVAGNAVVACSHGDVIPVTVAQLAKRFGLDVGGVVRCAKGSVWRFAGDDEVFHSVSYHEFGQPDL